MNEDVAKRWMAALRSGNYVQGFGQLQKNGRFCARGVLCDILNPGGWKRDVLVGGMQMDMQATTLPQRIIDAAGIRPNMVFGVAKYNVDIDRNGRQYPLVYLNDR